MELIKGLNPDFKDNYIRLIASGFVERNALAALEVDWFDFFELCSKDPEFRAGIDNARKARADRWVDGIAESLDKIYEIEIEKDGKTVTYERPPNKDEIARDKLQFEKMKFLAQADNPEKYAQGGKLKVAVDIDMSDFKLLSPQESIKVLNNDPFNKMVTIDAEVVKETTNDDT